MNAEYLLSTIPEEVIGERLAGRLLDLPADEDDPFLRVWRLQEVTVAGWLVPHQVGGLGVQLTGLSHSLFIV